ncbi:unnamed protein product [Brassica oleracea]|uniref:(rape) hypothetical protein n=1 Tax=Brassica napus TaxID=3708 RepID=A0A816IR10_BRANA|nr:unnamed protein product [Brassica napus]
MRFCRTGSESLVIGSHRAGADVWPVVLVQNSKLLKAKDSTEERLVGSKHVHCVEERRCKVTRSGGEKHWPRDPVEGGGGTGGSTGSITSRYASGGYGGKRREAEEPATGWSSLFILVEKLVELLPRTQRL